MPRRLWIGMKLLVVFFAFGATACTVTIAALLAPAGGLDFVWRLNPEAQMQFQEIGTVGSVLLMVVVGSACACARPAWRAEEMGTPPRNRDPGGNLIGDCVNFVIRHDSRTLIGLPIGGAMVVYLWKSASSK